MAGKVRREVYLYARNTTPRKLNHFNDIQAKQNQLTPELDPFKNHGFDKTLGQHNA